MSKATIKEFLMSMQKEEIVVMVRRTAGKSWKSLTLLWETVIRHSSATIVTIREAA